MRIPRFLQLTDGDTLHVYWKCTNSDQDFLLEGNEIKEHILKTLVRSKERYGITLYDYALMDNHLHLALKIDTVTRFSRYLQSINTSIAKRINHLRHRTGAVVMDRCKISVIDLKEEGSLLNCQAYLHLNRWACSANVPPERYRYCGYGLYALGHDNPLLDPSPEWVASGTTDTERQSAFVARVREKMETKQLARNAQKQDDLELPACYWGSKTDVAEKTRLLKKRMQAHLQELRTKRLALDSTANTPAGSDCKKI